MTDTIPSAINFHHLDQGINLFCSHNPQYRKSQQLLFELRENPAYNFLINNFDFNDALRRFQSKRCIKNSQLLCDDVVSDELREACIVLSLMGIIAQPMANYLNEKESGFASCNVVKTTVNYECAKKLLDVLDHLQLQPVAVSTADYLEMERVGMLFVNKLRDGDFSEFPARQADTKLFTEKRLAHEIYKLYFAAWKAMHPSVIGALSRILLNDISENTIAKWLKSSRKRALENQKSKLISAREHKVNDKYFR